jgi:hypothetical protein
MADQPQPLRCPHCGHELPEKTYEYTGYLAPHLPIILKMLEGGSSPQQISDELHKAGCDAPEPAISYIAKKYRLQRWFTPKPKIDYKKRDVEMCVEYQSGNTTYEELSKRHNLSMATVKRTIGYQTWAAEYETQGELWRSCNQPIPVIKFVKAG